MRLVSATALALSSSAQDEDSLVRLHITPLQPELLSIYLGPAILPLAQNVSYHTVQTFPEKGFGYVELPQREAQKLINKLSGTVLRGSKVRIEMAKSEKRKIRADEPEQPSKRAKKRERSKQEPGVLDGLELADDRKVKRGWTEPQRKSKKDSKARKENRENDQTHQQKASKYTSSPELLFKAKLTPVAATEATRKEKGTSRAKEGSKGHKKSPQREVVVHEFQNNSKTLTFLKQTSVKPEKKPAVDYVDGKGWVDEDGNIVEAETNRARQRRALELVDKPTEAQKAWIDGPVRDDSSRIGDLQGEKAKDLPPASSNVEALSTTSSLPDNPSADESNPEPARSTRKTRSQKVTEASPASKSDQKEIHPLEALFKRNDPAQSSTATSAKRLTPIKTTFSFFETNEDDVDEGDATVEKVPSTPFTQADFECRGLRSAAPTPDTAAIGRHFSFDWRGTSQEVNDDEEVDDAEAQHLLSQNTKANAVNRRLPDVAEEEEEASEVEGAAAHPSDEGGERVESEFRKWFYDNRGDLNRAWKKRRRDALKAKRLHDNKKMSGGG